MSKVLISETTEEKRLEDFRRIAENWDNIPEYARGKMDGIISVIAALCTENQPKEVKAG